MSDSPLSRTEAAVLARRAHDLRSAGHLDEAEHIFRRLLKSDSTRFNYGMAVTLAARGETQEALHYYWRHEASAGLSTKTRLRIARLQAADNNPRAAQETLLEGLQCFEHNCALTQEALSFPGLWLSERDLEVVRSAARTCPQCRTVLARNDLNLAQARPRAGSAAAVGREVASADSLDDLRNRTSVLVRTGDICLADGWIKGLDKYPPDIAPAFSFWDSKEPPEEVQSTLGSWTSRSSLEHPVYDDTSARAYIERFGPDGALEAFNRAHHPAMRSDLFRLVRLLHDGGIYIDADEQSVGPFERLWEALDRFDIQRLFCLWGVTRQYYISNHFIAAQAGDALIARLLEAAIARTLSDEENEGRISWHTGPMMFTEIVFGSLACPETMVSTAFLSRAAYHKLFPKLKLSYKRDLEKNWRNF